MSFLTPSFRLILLTAMGAQAGPLSSHAAVVGMNVPAQSVTYDRIAALPPAEQPAWRAYLDRSVQQMERDQAVFRAELKTAGLAQAIVPKESKDADSVPIHRAASYYGSADARRIADIILSFQTPAGGWSKNLNMAAHLRRPGEFYTTNNISHYLGRDDFDTPHDRNWNYVGTFDNDATTTQLHFLAKVADSLDATAGAPYRTGFLRGLGYIFAAQFPNGGWPQVWPLEGAYHDTITYNDEAMIETLELLEQVSAGDFKFVPAEAQTRAAASVGRGIACIIATQIVANGHRTVWCQQHDALTLQPASGRNFEPPVQCGSESAALMLFLMSLPHPSPEVVDAVHAAAAWFKKTAIYGQGWSSSPTGRRWGSSPRAGPIWARYYENGTDRPIFGDRDKTLHDDVNELSPERRSGYQWYGSKPREALDRYRLWSDQHPARS